MSRTWGDEERAALPAPLLTSVQSVEMGWEWWPPMVLTAQRAAQRAGWETTLGFARGYKPGRGENSPPTLIDTVAVHVRRGAVTGALVWDRLVDGSYEWKPAGACFRMGAQVAPMGHAEAKRRLKL
jgi:hypothetical protein